MTSLTWAGVAVAATSDWVSVRFPDPYSRATSERAVVAVSEDADGAVWAATNDGAVFVLREGAKDWREVSAGLPRAAGDEGIQEVEELLAVAGKVYLNCDEGVFVLPRGGDRWRVVSEVWEPQVFYLTFWDGYVWGIGAGGVHRLDPEEDRWTEVSGGLPYLAGERTHAGSVFWLSGANDYLYVGIQETHDENPRFDRAGVYRLPRGATTWQNAGLHVKLAPAETKHLETEEEAAAGASWGPRGIWVSGSHVLCEWGGLSYEGFVRFYALEESGGAWTQLREPAGGDEWDRALEELADVYPLPGEKGRFAFVGACDPREGEADAWVYDAGDGSWSRATLPVVGWPAGGWSGRDASWGWVLDGDRLVTGDPEGAYAPSTSTFVASVPLPTEVSRDPGVVGTNLALALLFAVGFGFTSTLFNSTLRENHETVRRWVRPLVGPADVVARRLSFASADGAGGRSRVRRLVEPLSIVVLAALIYSFLDPTFGLSAQGLQLFLSLLVSVSVVTYLYEGLQCRLCRTHYHAPAALRLYPAALLVAVACVLVSRLAGFSPGYVYGFVGAMAFLTTAQPSLACRGRMVLVSSLGLLAVSVATWFLAVPLSNAAASGGWLVHLLQAMAVAVFVAGLESVFFGLVPLSFMDGETLLRWRKPVWLAVFALVTFMFWHVLLNKDSEYAAAFSGQSTRVMVGVLAAFTALTLASFVYFRSRRPYAVAGTPAGTAAAALPVTVAAPSAAPRAPEPARPAGPTASLASAVAARASPALPDAVAAATAPGLLVPPTPAVSMPAQSVVVGGMKPCPACGAEIRAAARICRFCRTRLHLQYSGYCAACHDIVGADESGVCGRCGGSTVDLHVGTAVAAEGSAAGTTPALAAARAATVVAPARRSRPPQVIALVAGVAGLAAGAGLIAAWEMKWWEQMRGYVVFYENPPGLLLGGFTLIVLGVVMAILRRRRMAVLGLGIASLVVGGFAVWVMLQGRATLEEAGLVPGGDYEIALALGVSSMVPGVLAVVAAALRGWERGGSR